MPEDSRLESRFQQCVDDHADAAFRVAFRLLGNRDRAEELVQETYVQAWRSLNSLKDPQKIRSWLFAILRNQYAKSLRSNRPVFPLESEPIQQAERSPDVEEAQELVQQAIQQLDEEHRLPLLLVAMEGMSAEDAGETLGIPRGTVLSRLHRARQKLKMILEPKLNAIQSP